MHYPRERAPVPSAWTPLACSPFQCTQLTHVCPDTYNVCLHTVVCPEWSLPFIWWQLTPRCAGVASATHKGHPTICGHEAPKAACTSQPSLKALNSQAVNSWESS